MFCREIVADLRAARAADPAFPEVLFAHQGSVAQGNAFFMKRWPEVRAIADSGALLYDAFGVERGRLAAVVGPTAMVRGVKAALRGHLVGKPVGDVWRMPGAFLLDGDAIVWAQEPEHSGDHPDLAEVRALTSRVRSGPTESQDWIRTREAASSAP